MQPDDAAPGYDSWRFGRRAILAAGLAAAPAMVLGAGVHRNTKKFRVQTVRLTEGDPTCRLVQISDVHHRGDVAYAEEIVRAINALDPDLVCFTGDLIEHVHFLPEALELLGMIDAPLFGIPGNHDYWSGARFGEYAKRFAAGGGAWLVNATAPVREHGLAFVGVAERNTAAARRPAADRCVLLTHYPIFVDDIPDLRFDLILAGHSHGGQVRLPGMEARFVPFYVGPYDRGLYNTPAGPLYVNSGIGTATVPFRINCPPEITLFEL